MIKSCESIGYFYINENMSVKCEVIKRWFIIVIYC
jgi:hypothetical protein